MTTPKVSTSISIAETVLQTVGTKKTSSKTGSTTTLVSQKASATFGPVIESMSKLSKELATPVRKEVKARLIAPFKKDTEAKTVSAIIKNVEEGRIKKAEASGVGISTTSPAIAPVSSITPVSSVATTTPSATTTGTAQSRAVRADLKETEIGFALADDEKPVIKVILSGDLTNTGFPRSNTLLIQRLQSQRVKVKKYSIFRKNVFQDLEYVKIQEIEVGDAVVEEKYISILKQLLQANPYDYFSFTDTEIVPNAVYAYKLRVDYDLVGPNDRLPTVVVKSATDTSPEITRPSSSTTPASKAGVLIKS